MKLKTLIALMVWLWAMLGNPVQAKPLELPEIQVVPMKDSATGRQYELYIKLPEDYDEKGDKQHPVIYYSDAMWHVELLSSATAFLMEEAILVGISWQTDMDPALLKEEGAHVSRYRDYTIAQSSNPKVQAKYNVGQASQFLSFIRTDVFEYVESNYQTDPSERTYFGYSLGGLFGAYTLLAQPDTFKNYIIGSPSVRQLDKLQAIADANPAPLNANVYISHGSLEDELGGHVEAFVAYLKGKNDKTLSLTHEIPNGSHQTAFPLTGVQSVTWLSNLKQSGKKS